MNFRTYLFIAILSLTIVGATAPGLSNPRNLYTGQLNNSTHSEIEEIVGKTYQVGVDANGNPLPGLIMPPVGHPSISTGANVVLFRHFLEKQFEDDVFAVVAQIYNQGEPTKGELATIVEDANYYESSSISADGRFVAYSYRQPDIHYSYDIYLYDRDNPSYPAKNITEGANGASTWPSISANGQYVAFFSQASNLVADDDNGKPDVFVYDRETDTIALVSRNSSGEIADEGVGSALAISADGLHVAYSSGSTNLDELVPNPPYPWAYKTTLNSDLSVKKTEGISIAPDGSVLDIQQDPAISGDGRYVAFSSNSDRIYVRDTVCQDTTLISSGLDGLPSTSAQAPQISVDGRFVVFNSFDNDLVENDANECSNNTGNCPDVFIHDYLGDRSTQLISVTPMGSSGNSVSWSAGISPDGRTVYFRSSATDLIENQVSQHLAFLRRLPPVDPIPERDCPVKLAGRAIDRNGSPISGVTVSSGSGQDTLTQNDGTFELTLTPGVYTVTVAKGGYSFTPASQTVELTQDIALGDFIGVADGGPVAPFLDLPFAYSGEPLEAFGRATKGYHEAQGQIWSWYDHNLPDYVKNDMLWRYFDKNENGAWIGGLYTVGGIFYDGHDAYDFVSSANLTLSEIRAAADGRVVSIKEDCVAGDKACGLRHGNHVVIDHENGYFTLYSHLSSVAENISTVPPNNTVLQGQTLGIIGWTGNTTGVHLHFAVYRDSPQSPGWNGIRSETPVDPFGWSLPEPDPWVTTGGGPVSTYLWKHNIADTSKSTGDEGTTLTSATGDVEVFVPIEVLQGDFSATIFPISTDRIQADLRSSGYSFLLKLEHYSPATYGQHVKLSSQVAGSSSAISISVDYSDSSLRHLDESLLTIFQRKAGESAWTPLDTTIQIDSKVATAETNAFGTFSLQAPLLCPEDETEPDDFMLAAPEVTIGAKYKRWIDSAGDEDWFIFDVDAGQEVLFETSELGPGVNTIIGVYDGSANLLVSDNDSGLGGGSRINWQAPNAGTYFLKVIPDKISSVGCEATYTLTVQGGSTEMFSIFMPSILKTQ